MLGFSAEDASLEIEFSGQDDFASAGYATLVTNSTYHGGFVRQSGNLSFSRVFQAGHSAGGYQPETVGAIFERSIFRRDVATGEVTLSSTDEYSTKGKASVRDVKNELPKPIENICYVLDPGPTCTWDQYLALANGTAKTKDWKVVWPEGSDGETEKNASEDSGSDKDGKDGEETETKDGESAASALGPHGWVVALALLVLAAL
jgi:carboxypeptidase D